MMVNFYLLHANASAQPTQITLSLYMLRICQRGAAPMLGNWGMLAFGGSWCNLRFLFSNILLRGLFFPLFGKRSNFLGTKFTIFDGQPPHSGAKIMKSRSTRLVNLKQVSPKVPAGNYPVAHISYELNVLGSR